MQQQEINSSKPIHGQPWTTKVSHYQMMMMMMMMMNEFALTWRES